MRSVQRLAEAVAAGITTWDALRPWARVHAEAVCAADPAISDWELDMGRFLYRGGEEGIEWALDRRSQHAFARELFRDTPADELLAAYEDAEVDKDFREAAARVALDAPDYVPTTHTWWRWPTPT